MLKIKDNVDLKELEKYGFESKFLCYIKEIKRKGITHSDDETKVIFVDELDNKISIKKGLFSTDIELDTIYDLIKDGLVEKVDE